MNYRFNPLVEAATSEDFRGVTKVTGIGNRRHGRGKPVERIDVSDCAVKQATRLDTSRQEDTHLFPQFLPDGQHFLWVAVNRSGQKDIYVGSLGSEQRQLLIRNGSIPSYVPPGYLVFARGGSCWPWRLTLGVFAPAVKLFPSSGEGFLEEESGFRVEEAITCRQPEIDYREKALIFGTESEAVQYIIKKMAEQIAHYQHIKSFRTGK